MKLNFVVKQLGKKRPALSLQSIEIEGLTSPVPLKDIIQNIVEYYVNLYNNKKSVENLIPFITLESVSEQAAKGKIGFGSIYNENKANLDNAITNAFQSFEDGTYCIFIDNEQIESLDEIVSISNESVIAFVRLSFLVGSFW